MKTTQTLITLLSVLLTASFAQAACPSYTFTQGGKTIEVTYSALYADNTYQIVINSDEEMTGIGAGTYVHMSGQEDGQVTYNQGYSLANPADPYGAGNKCELSPDGHTITCSLFSYQAPQIYTGLHIQFAAGGEVLFGDVNKPYCDETVPDAPVPVHNDYSAIYSSSYCDADTPNCNNANMDYYTASRISGLESRVGSRHAVAKRYCAMGTFLPENGILLRSNGETYDFSAFDSLHVDLYIPDDGLAAVDHLSVDLNESGEFYQLEQPLSYGAWQRIDIPLSFFTHVDMTSIWKIRFRFGEGGYNTYSNAQTHPYQVLLDNLYVYNTLEPNIRVSATTNLQNARLTWTSVNFIEEPFAYTVRYSSDKGNTWTTASTAAVSPYIVTGLSSGVDYLFEVEGVSGIQWGTGRASATTLVPFAPTYAWEPSNVYSLYSTQYGVAEQYGSGGMAYANGTVTNHVIDATHTVEKYTLAGLTGNRPQYGMLWIVDFLGGSFGQYNYWHVDLFIPDNEVTRTITHIRFWDSEYAGNYTDIPVQALGTWSRYDVPIQRESTYRLLIVPMVDDSYPASEYSLFMDQFLLYKSSTAVKSLQASPNIRVYAQDTQIMVDLEGSEVLQEVKVWNLSGQSLPGDVRYDGNHATLSIDSGIHLIQVVTNTGSWLYKILR